MLYNVKGVFLKKAEIIRLNVIIKTKVITHSAKTLIISKLFSKFGNNGEIISHSDVKNDKIVNGIRIAITCSILFLGLI